MEELKQKIARAIFEADFPGSEWPGTPGYAEVYGDCATAALRTIEAAGYVIVPKDLSGDSGPLYSAGEYSRRNWDAAIADRSMAIPTC